MIATMMGIELEEDWHVHKAPFKHLFRFSDKEILHMMTSDEWTRAVFVREPKERVLSAFLNKFCNEKEFFNFCCKRLDDKGRIECRDRMRDCDFRYFLKRTRDCPNQHWDLQSARIDTKWWPSISFIGHMSNIEVDSRTLLESITSTEDPHESAWEKYGKIGWGKNGTQSFFQQNTAVHATNSHDKLKTYYKAPCDEAFVEKYWAEDWTSPYFVFDTVKVHENVTDMDFDVDCKWFDKHK